MPYSDEDCIAISGLQHLAFCERQWGLIHLEQEWAENRLTAEGRTLHERVDEGYREFRRGLRQYSWLHVQSRNLGIYGRLDVLEAEKINDGETELPLLNLRGTWQLRPVEFKHGKPKDSDVDEVQLCAQALCLEEMTGTRVPEGSIFYGEIRRREEFPMTEDLRRRTGLLIQRAHELLFSHELPQPIKKQHCRACSLVEICMPRAFQTSRINEYRQELLG
ncbi:MAG TPA: CRISPR-associated protein Cas4 [Fibrobacteraceae bacterium]|nr:CRISPR-associated protein Cas4 [Fibrobacteraceae bacterium]